MKSEAETYPETGTPYERFRELARKLVSVPKKEADAKGAQYQRKKQTTKRSQKA